MQKERLRFFPYSLFFGGVISFLIGLRSWRYRLPRWIIPLGVYCKYIISFSRRVVNEIIKFFHSNAKSTIKADEKTVFSKKSKGT